MNIIPKVVLAGSVTTRSGYGSHARDIAKALIKSGKYDVGIIPIRWGSTPSDALDPENPDDQLILSKILMGPLQEPPDIFIHLTIPNEFQRAGKFNIGLTAGIESTLCRMEWLQGCNNMDLVLTTSQHSARVLQGSRYDKKDQQSGQVVETIGLNRPMDILFEGVDLNVFNGKIDTQSEIIKTLNDIPEDFCYLFVGHWLQGAMGQDRKDVGMLIKTFIDTFKEVNPKNRPALILKTSMAGFSIMEKNGIVKKIQAPRHVLYLMTFLSIICT